MDLKEAMLVRHSVRSFLDKRIEGEEKEKLEAFIRTCNSESGLHMQLITDEKEAFSSLLAHYGSFRNVRNYIAVAGRDTPDLDEKCGYFGEKAVLYATTLGLDTCWVALSFSRKKTRCSLEEGEKLALVIAIGYGADKGKMHKSKSLDSVIRCEGNPPLWFTKGAEAALLAPTAMNQQKFRFTLAGDDKVKAEALFGPYSAIDLGIAKYHFEIGAGRENFHWA